jgi:hypothetical protein
MAGRLEESERRFERKMVRREEEIGRRKLEVSRNRNNGVNQHKHSKLFHSEESCGERGSAKWLVAVVVGRM